MSGAEEAVDLSKASAAPSSHSAASYHRAPVKSERLFKVFFDLSLYSLTDYAKLTFANFHSFLFLDVIPNKDVQFSFDVSSSRGSPSFYELDWRVSPTTQIRIGKIRIPFDDLSPHSLFGGRTNVSA